MGKNGLLPGQKDFEIGKPIIIGIKKSVDHECESHCTCYRDANFQKLD